MAAYYGTDAERNRAQQGGGYQMPTYTPAPLANQANPGASYRPPSTPSLNTSTIPKTTTPTTTTPTTTKPTTAKPTTATSSASVTPKPLTPSVSAQTFQGFTPKHAMEGFDFRREQNTGKSAKDAFAYLSNQAPPPPINNKAALGAWFNQYIKPGMDQLGHKVMSVDGDKFRFANWQGQFDVDYGRGAGAEGGALAWQVDDPTAQMSNGAYVPQPIAAIAPDTEIDPLTGLPIRKPVSTTMPISSAIQYRRPYGNYAQPDEYTNPAIQRI